MQNNTGSNLVGNPNFEVAGKWSEQRDSLNRFPATSFFRSNWGTAAGRNGGSAYVISNHAYGYLDSDTIAVTAGTRYQAQAYVRGEIDPEDSGGYWRVRIQFYTNTLGIGDNGFTDVAIQGYFDSARDVQWKQVGGVFKTPTNTTHIKFRLFSHMNSGWIAFDDVEVQEAPVITKYYYFNGQRIAMRKDGVLTYLHSDHLGSTVLQTDDLGNQEGSMYYRAYGLQRGGDGLPTENQFTGQKQDGSGLQFFNARYYDPALGMFISPDTLIPDASHLLSYNRYMYTFGNPMRYTDPSGHCPWCITAAIGAAIGGAVTGATYMLTTDYAQWTGGDIATVVGAGAIAGGLIGSGVGIAAGTVQMSAALATASAAAVASGSGAAATAEAYMVTNKIYGQQFDRSDFVVSTGTAAVEGAVNSMVPGSGLAVGATRAAISAGFGSADYLARNHFNGADGQSTFSGALGAGAIWGAGSAAGDLLGGGFSSPDPSLLRNTVTSRDMTFTVWYGKLNGKLIREGIQEEAKNAWRPSARNFGALLWTTISDKEAQE